MGTLGIVRIRKLVPVGLLGTAGILLFAQLMSVRRDNPPVAADTAAPPKIESVLRRACYDCHSNETRWPRYSAVAPFSWLIVHDVTLGRKEINFSEWGSYYPTTRHRKLQWMGRALREERMPPWSYRLMHPDARLTEGDRVALQRWIESELSNTSTQTPN